MQETDICIIGLKCHDLLIGSATPRYIGGVETHLTLLAKALAADGLRVSFVTYDHGQPDGSEYEGVIVRKAYRGQAGLPGLRFLHPRWTGLCRALARAAARERPVKDDGAEETDREAEGGQDQVLPAGLKRAALTAEGNQHGRGGSARLNQQPRSSQIVGQRQGE